VMIIKVACLRIRYQRTNYYHRVKSGHPVRVALDE